MMVLAVARGAADVCGALRAFGELLRGGRDVVQDPVREDFLGRGRIRRVRVVDDDYERELACLGALLDSRAQCIGVLGPSQRTERMLGDLSRAGTVVADEALARVHAPVGLDLGAETPDEIVLAIVAEVQATLICAPGRRSRERCGPIHTEAE